MELGVNKNISETNVSGRANEKKNIARHQKRFVVMEENDPIFYDRNRKILMDINIGGEEVTQNKLIYHHGIELIFLH